MTQIALMQFMKLACARMRFLGGGGRIIAIGAD